MARPLLVVLLASVPAIQALPDALETSLVPAQLANGEFPYGKYRSNDGGYPPRWIYKARGPDCGKGAPHGQCNQLNGRDVDGDFSRCREFHSHETSWRNNNQYLRCRNCGGNKSGAACTRSPRPLRALIHPLLRRCANRCCEYGWSGINSAPCPVQPRTHVPSVGYVFIDARNTITGHFGNLNHEGRPPAIDEYSDKNERRTGELWRSVGYLAFLVGKVRR
jgi:hypothetical protein